jgi:hypothetical protein
MFPTRVRTKHKCIPFFQHSIPIYPNRPHLLFRTLSAFAKNSFELGSSANQVATDLRLDLPRRQYGRQKGSRLRTAQVKSHYRAFGLPLTPCSIQSAAVSMLLKKAYQPYHFPEPTAAQQTLFKLDQQDIANAFNPASPPTFKLGTKVCLAYNRNPEIYIVIGAAFRPGHPTIASDEVQAITDGLASRTDATIKDIVKAPSPSTATSKPGQEVDHSTKFVYLVVPSGAKTLKPNTDLNTAKTILAENLSAPPRFAVGRVLLLNLPIDRHSNTVVLPIEISSIQRGLGFAAGADANGAGPSFTNGTMDFRAPWEDTWKYKLTHSGDWVSEETLVAMVDGNLDSLDTAQVNWS